MKGTPTGPEANVFRIVPSDPSPREQRFNLNPLRRFAETGPVGGAKNQGPIDPWARLAHALFQTNEAVFYN